MASYQVLYISHCPTSEEEQETEEERASERPSAGARRPLHARGGHPRLHAPVGARHAVGAPGHRARDHLLGLRRNAARHVVAPDEHAQQARGAAGHLGRQVGQVAAR